MQSQREPRLSQPTLSSGGAATEVEFVDLRGPAASGKGAGEVGSAGLTWPQPLPASSLCAGAPRDATTPCVNKGEISGRGPNFGMQA